MKLRIPHSRMHRLNIKYHLTSSKATSAQKKNRFANQGPIYIAAHSSARASARSVLPPFEGRK